MFQRVRHSQETEPKPKQRRALLLQVTTMPYFFIRNFWELKLIAARIALFEARKVVLLSASFLHASSDVSDKACYRNEVPIRLYAF